MQDAWVITDGGAGNRRQALALARALGLDNRSLVLASRAPWSWLAWPPAGFMVAGTLLLIGALLMAKRSQ